MDIIHEFIASGIWVTTFMVYVQMPLTLIHLSLILSSATGSIYHDICASFRINGIQMVYPEFKRQTPVAFRIIKALWTDDVDELTTRLAKGNMIKDPIDPSQPPKPDPTGERQPSFNPTSHHEPSQVIQQADTFQHPLT